MAYYTIIPNTQGYVSDPGFMQNITALANTMGKGINSAVYKDAAAKNGLVPEYDVDQNTGDTKISYKSPELINRGFYSAGAPGNPAGKPTQQNFSKIIQDAIAQNAVKNATAEVPPGEDLSQAGWSLDAGQEPSMTTSQTGDLPTDHSQIFQDALMKQANDSPLVAKSIGVPTSTMSSKKETLDTAIADAQAGTKTWAEVINQYPTKIKQIQQAKRGLAAANAADNSTPATVSDQGSPKTGSPAGAVYFSPSQNKYYDAQGNEVS